MNKVTKTLLFVLLTATTLLFAKNKQDEVITKSFNTSKGGHLVVNVNPGDIYVKTWDKDEVLVKVDGLDKEDAQGLTMKSSGNEIRIKYENSWGWGVTADYYFTIPANYNLELESTGGRVDIQNDIVGDINIKTMGGRIGLKNVDGNIKVKTMGGNIQLSDVTGKVYLSTQGGDIVVGRCVGSVTDIKTMGGDIDAKYIKNANDVTTYGGSIDIKEAGENFEAKTFGGNINIDKAANNIDAVTYGGNITIGSANGFVKVSTGGGNISLKNINGTVDAKTGAGNISVELNPSGQKGSRIKTNMGDIVLTIASSAKATVEAEVNTYGGKENYKLESDFEGKLNKNFAQIEGTYNINGGGSKIRVETNKGSIKINKK